MHIEWDPAKAAANLQAHGVSFGEAATVLTDDLALIGQYQDFLEALENDPYGEETKETREWAGLDFDPERFDRKAANNAIDRLLWNGWIKIGV